MINILILAHFHKFWKLSQFFIFEKKKKMSKFEPKKTEDMSALESLEDRDLLYTCSQSSYMNNLCDNTFFKRRFMKR